MRKPYLRALAVTSAAAVAVGAGVLVAAHGAQRACEATYSVDAQWKGGFTGNVALRNLGEPVSNWKLTWAFGAGQRLVRAWGASATQAGSQVTATGIGNKTLGKDSSVKIRFVGTGSGKDSTPATIALNGVTCTGPPAPQTPSGTSSQTPSSRSSSTLSSTASETPSETPSNTTPAASPSKPDEPQAAADCKEPTPMAVPAKRSVVGTGTTTTCTESALRSAVTAGGQVTFDCGGGNVTIPVTQEIKTKATTVIDGGGKVTLKGGGSNRILLVENGTTLSVRNLQFVKGAAAQSDKREISAGGAVAGMYKTHVEVIGSTFQNNTAGMGGGAVYVGTDSTLSITRSTFSGNSSWYGGAVYSLLSPLTVVNSTFNDNSTVKREGAGDGGAIGTDGAAPMDANGSGGKIHICGSSFNRNKGHGSGGGIYLWAYARDQIVVDRSTFKDNTVEGIGGGARISIGPTDYGKTGSITISGTSVLSNSSSANGGGLYLDCAPTCAISNSTFYRNASKTYGGAIFGDGHHDNNVTFAENTAGGHGGALFGSKFVLNNTVFVGNSSGNPWKQAMTCSDTGTGAQRDAVAHLVPDNSSCLSQVTAADPQLSKPADNGGTTLTMMPGQTSPVLKAGSGCTPSDQRGVVRKDSVCDLGAVQRS